MEFFHEGQDVFHAIGEFLIVRCIAARMALDGFGPHITFDDRDVAKEIAERESSWGVGPVDFIWRDAASDAHGAFADVLLIAEEGLDGMKFHEESVARIEEEVMMSAG